MDLRERKLIINGATEKLPEYENGKPNYWLHKPSSDALAGMATTGINFAGSVVNSFGPVKSSEDILTESGKSVGQGSGFSYLKQNAVDVGAQMNELSKLNTANTLNTAASGASLGSAFGPIGAGIGGVVGGAVGFIGGLFRKNKMAERIRQALIQATRNNNFNLASAQTDYLTNQYNVEHDNTQDDMLYAAKEGLEPSMVDNAMLMSGFVKNNGRYVFDGRMKISNGEVYGHVDNRGRVIDAHVAGNGVDNKDSLIRRAGNTPNEVERAFVLSNKKENGLNGIAPSTYAKMTKDYDGAIAMQNYSKEMKSHTQEVREIRKAIENGAFGLPTDILAAKCGKLPRFEDAKLPKTSAEWADNTMKSFNMPTYGDLLAEKESTRTIGEMYNPKLNFTPIRPYVLRGSDTTDYTKLNAPDFTYKPKQMGGFLSKDAKDFFSGEPTRVSGGGGSDNSDNSNWANAITSGMGILGGLSLILGAHNQKLNKPDTYAPNQLERQALDIYGWLNPATNRAVQAAAATEARNRYNINRMGGLSGAQKYLAAVLSGVGLQNNIASIIADVNRERNQYRSQLAGAMMNAGASDAQRRQNANQYLEEAYARAHGARTQMEQMGMQNILAAFNQYYKNFDKLNRFNRTMAYYDLDYQLRKDALNKGWG